MVIYMKVKIFDESHEADLEIVVNEFLSTLKNSDIVSINYQVATLYDGRSQVYCFSCMIVYLDKSSSKVS